MDSIDRENIFLEEENLFKLTDEIDYTTLSKGQQKELKEQLNPTLYHPYVYDVDLEEEVINHYHVGQLLYQPTNLYTTSRITKPEKNVRYLIYSKEFQELPGKQLQLHYRNKQVAVSGILNCFKVIDITVKDNITQITLLHYNSFEELAIQHHKTSIEEKISKRAPAILEEEYPEDDIDLKKLNYKLDAGIGLKSYRDRVKPFNKDHIIFLLEVLSEIHNHYPLKKVVEFTETYDIIDLINNYQQSLDNMKKMKVSQDTSYEEEQQKITDNYKNKIINSMKISENLKENTLGQLSENHENLSNSEKIDEVSEVLNIPQEKLEKLLKINK